MKGDGNLFRHARRPYLTILVAAVGGGIMLGASFLTHILKNDPTLLLRNKKENPYPWINVPQTRNLKLYAVNNKVFNHHTTPSQTIQTISLHMSKDWENHLSTIKLIIKFKAQIIASFSFQMSERVWAPWPVAPLVQLPWAKRQIQDQSRLQVLRI